MTQDMTQRYRKFKRTGMYYAYDNFTGNSVSLKTRVRAEVVRSRASARVKCLRKSVSEWSGRANGSSNVLKKSQRLPAIARMGSRELKSYCMRTEPTMELLKFALNDLNLSARAYDRILKVARTIADLAGADDISGDHVSEAIQFRWLYRQLWT